MKLPTFIFFWFLMSSIMMAFSTSSLFFLWICLEINMMSFIPLMYSKNMISMNSIVMYFLIQSTASSIYIFSTMLLFFNTILMNYFMIFIMITMLIKLGAAPFHIWFPQISEGLTFNSLSILLTFQKMIPSYIISLFQNNSLIPFIILSAMIGSFGGFNQSSLRKILAFSSISHLSWILSLTLTASNFWLIYLVIYSTIIIITINMIGIFSINFLNSEKIKWNEINFFLIIMLLTLGGMPPTIGFFMKWMSLKIIFNNIAIITIPLILSSLINLFFYMRLSYTAILKNTIFHKWDKYFMYKFFMTTLLQLLLIFILIFNS
uniref:NADH dehydrogenase subunit 2 n=1 Tax=Alectorobius rietcorreai TaxID=1905324 RepID=UPI002237D0BF|nr:NADH dehydrogenase subunit 2 [Alectorobius rietcorreai]UYB78561.1 NADH dehydrogenase subunit 2 [Alectorobius rietcorreai]